MSSVCDGARPDSAHRARLDDRMEVGVIPANSVDRDRLLRTFLELVAVDSPSGHEREIGDVLDGQVRRAGVRGVP